MNELTYFFTHIERERGERRFISRDQGESDQGGQIIITMKLFSKKTTYDDIIGVLNALRAAFIPIKLFSPAQDQTSLQTWTLKDQD